MRFNTHRCYRDVETYDSGTFRTRDGKHKIAYLRSGRPGARPVLIVHGGPGGGSSPAHLGFFHPRSWDIIQVCQRGAGRSRPMGGLESNDTDHLIEDFEQLRESLGIQRWTLWAGSWGTFLSLAYAEQHPDAVDALVLRAICLFSDAEMDVTFHPSGAAVTYPERFAEFASFVEPHERDDLMSAYYRRMIVSSDRKMHEAAAYQWSRWLSRLNYNDDGMPYKLSKSDVAAIRIECLYSQHRGFRDRNQLLKEADKLAGKPVSIIHGRRDLLCPPVNAFQLKQAIPHSDLTIVEGEGHSTDTAGMRAAVLRSTNALVS